MCLLSKYGTPRIAKKDIVCYKILFCDLSDSNWKTPFQNYVIENKVVYNKEPLYPINNEDIVYNKYTDQHEINSGFIHTYSTLSGAKMAIRFMFNSRPEYAIFKCIIPKGTYYFNGITGVSFYLTEPSFASKEIRFIKMLND